MVLFFLDNEDADRLGERFLLWIAVFPQYVLQNLPLFKIYYICIIYNYVCLYVLIKGDNGSWP